MDRESFSTPLRRSFFSSRKVLLRKKRTNEWQRRRNQTCFLITSQRLLRTRQLVVFNNGKRLASKAECFISNDTQARMPGADEPSREDFDLLMGLNLVNSQMVNVMFPKHLQKTCNQADLRRKSNPGHAQLPPDTQCISNSPSISSLPKQVGSNRSVFAVDEPDRWKFLRL